MTNIQAPNGDERAPERQVLADRQLAEFIASMSAGPPMSASGDVVELRRATAERVRLRPAGPEMATFDVSLANGRCSARLYRPDGQSGAVIVYLHGGGWTIGGVDTHDRACRRLADRSRLCVLSVDYRLSPEHPFPAAIDDAVAALEWVSSCPGELGGSPGFVAVVGDSAGGTVAALAAIRLRDTELAPDLLMLLYANTDLAASGGSMDKYAHGFGLDAGDVEWFNTHWVADRSRWTDPVISPLRAADLDGLCPTRRHVRVRSAARSGRGLRAAPDHRRGHGDRTTRSRDGAQFPALGPAVAGMRRSR